MTQISPKYRETIFSAASAGLFFIVIGAIFAYTAFVENINLFDRIFDFLRLRNWELAEVFPNTRFVQLPIPMSSGEIQRDVYGAVARFGFIWSFCQVVILVLRLFAGSPISKKAETVSNAVSWLGNGYLSYILIEHAPIDNTVWFAFWAQMIIVLGISLFVRGIILAFRS